MKIVGMMPVRNEAWMLGFSARAALQWVDTLVVLDHASTDETPEILRELAAEYPWRVAIKQCANPDWTEMQHRQALLDLSRAQGATHHAIIDADEVLTANLLPEIRGHVAVLPRGAVLQLPMFYLRGDGSRYHANGIWGQRIATVAFADHAAANWQGNGFHHREPFGIPAFPMRPLTQQQGGVLHFWGVTEERLIARHALYKMTERLKFPAKPVAQIDRYYNLAMQAESGPAWAFAAPPAAWLSGYGDLLPRLDLSARPWQAEECRRLWREYGAAAFAGLDLFGVPVGQAEEAA